MARGFRDLLVWQKSMQLAVAVYRTTQEFPREEIYGITGQMRRSVISIPSNIAEGHGRLSAKEFRQFLAIARGSAYELQTQLELAKALHLGSGDMLDQSLKMSEEVGKMIFGLLHSVSSPPRVFRN